MFNSFNLIFCFSMVAVRTTTIYVYSIYSIYMYILYVCIYIYIVVYSKFTTFILEGYLKVYFIH